MFGEVCGMSMPWTGQAEIYARLDSLKKMKLKQKWFADFDWSRSSSIFFCWMPEGTICNLCATEVAQEVVSQQSDGIAVSEREFPLSLSLESVVGGAAMTLSAVSVDRDRTLATSIIVRNGRIEFLARAMSRAPWDLSEIKELLPADINSAIVSENARVDQIVPGDCSIKLNDIGPIERAFKWRRDIIAHSIGDVEFRHTYELVESAKLDLCGVGIPGVGFDVTDATPSDEFVEWFHGESEKIPKGRSLICNFPLKDPQGGNMVCLYLDSFKNKYRFVLCATSDNEDQMRKLAATKLGEFGFGDYIPIKR